MNGCSQSDVNSKRQMSDQQIFVCHLWNIPTYTLTTAAVSAENGISSIYLNDRENRGII